MTLEMSKLFEKKIDKENEIFRKFLKKKFSTLTGSFVS